MSAVRTSNAPPAAPEPAPMLVPVGQHKGGKPLSLKRSFTLVGSSASARLYLPSKAVSRCHAVVVNTGGGLFVRDLASRTLTRVNGQPVTEADLREGDVLQVGPFTFRFTDPTAAAVRPPTLPAPAATFEVEGLDEPLPLKGRTILIGRRETADISLTENSASSAHALLFVLEGRHVVRDLSSRTGTFVNGVKIHEQILSPADVVRVGETELRYRRAGGPAGAGAPGKLPGPASDRTAAVVPPASSTESGSDSDGGVDLAPLDTAPMIESEPGLSPSPALDPQDADHGPSNSGGAGLLEADGRSPGGGEEGTPSSGITAGAEGGEIGLRPADSP